MLNIYVGSMYSGKTSTLITNFYKYRKFKQLVIDFDTNNIYDNNEIQKKTSEYYHDKLYNHSKESINCIKTTNIDRLMIEKLNNDVKYIHINEAQFFKNLKVTILYLVEILKINVYIYGLDGDFKREKFGEILDLIPYCNNIIKLKGICNNCNNKALFSHRIVEDEQQLLFNNESESTYIPLCRTCYISSKK